VNVDYITAAFETGEYNHSDYAAAYKKPFAGKPKAED
jgi:hypothetical protein